MAPIARWFPSALMYERGVFFFKAEDGMRDLTVTGVQTCALPICVAQRVHMQVSRPRPRPRAPAPRESDEQALDRELHAARREPLPPPAHEHRPALLAGRREHDVTQPVVAPQGATGVPPHRDDPLLLPLAPDLELIGDES